MELKINILTIGHYRFLYKTFITFLYYFSKSNCRDGLTIRFVRGGIVFSIYD